MPPCHRTRSSIDFFGVRARIYGAFVVEINVGGTRVWLGTYCTTDEAARAYNAAAWRFNWSHDMLNFPKIPTQEEAEFLALPPLI
jgi:hypothetical protein